MSAPRTYEEFWPFYVSQHMRPATRRLHFAGTTGVLACLVAAAIVSPWWALAAPVAGYTLGVARPLRVRAQPAGDLPLPAVVPARGLPHVQAHVARPHGPRDRAGPPAPSRGQLEEDTGMLAAVVLAVMASAPLELAPGARYDPRIPTLQSVVGHDVGAEISTPDQIVAYLRALAAAAPERTRLVEYARTWEGRPLHTLVIAAPERIARLDAVKADLRRLADPRGLARGRSGSPRARAAGRDLAHPRRPRQRDLVVGRRARRGLSPARRAGRRRGRHDPPRVHRPHRPPREPRRPRAVPGPEPPRPRRRAGPRAGVRGARRALAGRPREPLPVRHEPRLVRAVPAGDAWGASASTSSGIPHVVVDLHEMGGESTYYFAPPAEPENPHITVRQRALVRHLRQGERGALRRARFRVLREGGLRLLLPRLRRELADLPGRGGDDLRAGLGARPRVPANRRHAADLPAGHRPALHRRHHHRGHRGPEPRAAAARLPRLPQDRRRRGAGARVPDPARCRSARARRAWRGFSRGRGSRSGRRKSRSGRAAAPSRRGRSSCPWRSPRRACCATSSIRASRWTRSSSTSRSAAAASGSPTRSTTSPRGACRSRSTSRSWPWTGPPAPAPAGSTRTSAASGGPPAGPGRVLPALGRGHGGGGGGGAAGRHPRAERRRRLHPERTAYPAGTAIIRVAENAPDLRERLGADPRPP